MTGEELIHGANKDQYQGEPLYNGLEDDADRLNFEKTTPQEKTRATSAKYDYSLACNRSFNQFLRICSESAAVCENARDDHDA